MSSRAADQPWFVGLSRTKCACDYRKAKGLFPHDRIASCSVAVALLALAGLLPSQPALAQSASNYTAGNMWGTSSSGASVPGAVDSAIAHGENSSVAAAVNAAKQGTLLGTGAGGGSIYSVGSQTIVSSTVIGDNNSAGINSHQSSSNTGDVSNQGQVGRDIKN